ncbi:hypothetical protein WMF31_39025 [Sorangium sp. So ce1036]|uniref:hypothetical protein n=1 Tax=Sorangium sp. So ce1036 TaxID=3133328 RepID=UPI003EFF20C6
MSYFYSVRGWLEMSPEAFPDVISIISTMRVRWGDDEKAQLYMKGWCWSGEPINWTRYVFYGADVTEEGLVMLRCVLSEMVLLGLDLSGYFHVQGEDGEKMAILRIEDDVLLEEELRAPG